LGQEVDESPQTLGRHEGRQTLFHNSEESPRRVRQVARAGVTSMTWRGAGGGGAEKSIPWHCDRPSRNQIEKSSFEVAMRCKNFLGAGPGEDSLLSSKAAKFGYALFATQSYVATYGLPKRPVRSLRGHHIVGNGHPMLMAWNTQLDEPAGVPLTVFPFISNLAAVVSGLGLGLVACVAGDQHPDLLRVSDVIGQWDLWMITNPEARNNARVRAVKDALAELVAAARERLSGGKMEPAGE